MHVLRIALIALTACVVTPPPAQPRERELAPTPAPPPRQAPIAKEPAPAPVVAREVPPELLVRPPVGGTGALLFLGSTARLDGMAITFAKLEGEGQLVTFDFQFVKGKKKENVRLRSDEEKFQAEVVAHGALYVFEQRAENMFTIMLSAASAPARLEDQACVELIDEIAKRGGITDASASTLVNVDGIVRVRRKMWTAYCARYTKRVWFRP